MAQKGESLYKIAQLMGNSPEICRRHYAALMPEKMHDTVEFEVDSSRADGKTEAMLQQILEKLDPKSSKQVRPKLWVFKAE